ncbi:glycosyltransferase involved in cell wall biosynthesis [Rhodopseudomonas julia]|uniref:Glycosyltransferase involved in cell wall biosynthesis n=1 Tax=Rhodopseudomonas julia TaxID=200617 RepID=A0ABU0C5U5_9BRAD|nr:glycosyltransferase [Rhodopseudomonas julia]MDQ0325879.1 glycosyltransferase involved in cell wall biosynthesis [Rhodopseudomonas julia]
MSAERAVLHVSRVGFLGGAERVILTLARGMEDYGYSPILACPGGGDLSAAAHSLSIPVTDCGFERMRATSDPLALVHYFQAWRAGSAQIGRLLTSGEIKLVHVHHPVGALYALPSARRLGIPVVMHVHEVLPIKPQHRLALRWTARHVDRFICVSGASRELLDTIGVSRERVEIVPNGVDPEFIEKAAKARPAAPIVAKGAPYNIGIFGVIEPRKAQHIFLQAAERIAAEEPGTHFWIVGPLALKDKEDYARRLRDMAETPALRGRVSFTGFQTDMPSWMAGMDVVALTSSSNESFGMVLAEAQIVGRPVVATDIGGVREAVCTETGGILVPRNDADAVAAAVLTTIRQQERLPASFLIRAARKKFSPDVFRARIAGIYEGVLGDQRMRLACEEMVQGRRWHPEGVSRPRPASPHANPALAEGSPGTANRDGRECTRKPALWL